MRPVSIAVALAALLSACGSGGVAEPRAPQGDTGGQTTTLCSAGASTGAVQAPVFVRNVSGQTGWFASPIASALGEPGAAMKIVAAQHALQVFDAEGRLLDSVVGNGQRIYPPHVVTDLDADGIVDIVFGQGHEVYAYEWIAPTLRLKAGWPADTTTAGQSPEVRGLAAADLEGDGRVEVVATTTQTRPAEEGGAQVFVFSSDGRLYQPAWAPYPAWPRYDARTGPGGDADRNGAGHHGYGCFGLNVGIGSLDDDPALEIVVTYDNHLIQAFDPDGTAIQAAPWFTNREPAWVGNRLTWGQFIRWADPVVEENHYHLHTGAWPSPATGQEWLQWTASPPNVVDLDGDGRNEVVGAPNVERNEPYETQAYAVMALDGAHGDGSRSAMRVAGWEVLPRGDAPIAVSASSPPLGIPAPATANIEGDARPEILVSLNDGFLSALDATGRRLWRHDFTAGKKILFASEPTVADLNQDGSPEVVFTTFGEPSVRDSGRLVVLAGNGALLHDVQLPNPGQDGNGSGAAAAPTAADLDGDGQLELLVQTFDHGIDVFTVPGSAPNCVLWSTARGGPLRAGAPSAGR